jgi:hypothetical protein
MGLDDRDYMRERHRKTFHQSAGRNPFTPPAERTSYLTIIGTWICVAFVIYKGYAFWHEKQQRERAARSSVIAAAHQQQREMEDLQQTLQKQQRAVQEQERTVQRQAQELQRRSTTEDAQPRSRIAADTPSEAPARRESTPATGGTIYHCKAYNGGTFWAQAHCSQHQALIDSIVSVPAGIPFEQQVQIAQQRRQALASSIYSAPVPQSSPPPAVANKAQCDMLNARVDHLDAMARQPQSAATQDWIRSERKTARDQQFALRC